jgi:hypothetical protein
MSSYVFSGFGGTVVPWASISTMQQVRDYAEAAVEASLSQCSSARAKYQEVLIKAEEALAEGNWDYNNPQKVSELRDSLDYANQMHAQCKAKAKGTTVQQEYEGTKQTVPAKTTVPPKPVGPAPKVTAGGSTWLWAAFAFAGVYFLKKKGKGGKAAPKKRARISRPKRRTRRTRRRR